VEGGSTVKFGKVRPRSPDAPNCTVPVLSKCLQKNHPQGDFLAHSSGQSTESAPSSFASGLKFIDYKHS